MLIKLSSVCHNLKILGEKFVHVVRGCKFLTTFFQILNDHCLHSLGAFPLAFMFKKVPLASVQFISDLCIFFVDLMPVLCRLERLTGWAGFCSAPRCACWLGVVQVKHQVAKQWQQLRAEGVHLGFDLVCVAVFTTIQAQIAPFLRQVTVVSGSGVGGSPQPCAQLCLLGLCLIQVPDSPGRESEIGGSRWPVRH